MPATLKIDLSREVFAALEATMTGTPQLVMDISYFEDARPEADRKTGAPDIVPRNHRVQMTAPGALQLDVGSPLESVIQLLLLNSTGVANTTHALVIKDHQALRQPRTRHQRKGVCGDCTRSAARHWSDASCSAS